jgi:hypothetical protein
MRQAQRKMIPPQPQVELHTYASGLIGWAVVAETFEEAKATFENIQQWASTRVAFRKGEE